jgi:Tachylectin/Astacin (Peptidase family M12A)
MIGRHPVVLVTVVSPPAHREWLVARDSLGVELGVGLEEVAEVGVIGALLGLDVGFLAELDVLVRTTVAAEAVVTCVEVAVAGEVGGEGGAEVWIAVQGDAIDGLVADRGTAGEGHALVEQVGARALVVAAFVDRVAVRCRVAASVDRLDRAVVGNAIVDEHLVEAMLLLDQEEDLVGFGLAADGVGVEAMAHAGVGADDERVDQLPGLVLHRVEQDAVRQHRDAGGEAVPARDPEELVQVGVEERLTAGEAKLVELHHRGEGAQVGLETLDARERFVEPRRRVIAPRTAQVAVLRELEADAASDELLHQADSSAGFERFDLRSWRWPWSPSTKKVTSSRHQNTTPEMRSKTAGAFLLASIAACGVVGDESIETSTDENELYGLGDAAPSWGDMNGAYVPICWANAASHPELQGKVLSILRETWGSYAKIDFATPSASTCAVLARKVTLSFSEETDYRGWTGTSAAGATTILIADRALGVNYDHFRYEVIHEFGHVLGFTHEQQRPDNWETGVAEECGATADDPDFGNYAPVSGGLAFTWNYDVNSVMNYCNPAGFPQDLSLGDIRGVRVAYGRRDVKGDIYAIDDSNQLKWYRHDGRPNGSWAWANGSGNVVGTGWSFKDVFAGEGSSGILYTIDDSNQLQWWRHDGRVDGGFRWANGSGNVVGYGWDFAKLFGAGDGIIYGVTPYVPGHYSDTYGGGYIPASGGELKWYRHDGRDDGSFYWGYQSGNVVGYGWNAFDQVFSGGDGVIYGLTPYVPGHYSDTYGGGWIPASGGQLKWYRHTGQIDGTFRWAAGSGNVVGTGWNFKKVFSGGDGVIYAVDNNNQLKWYRHDGRTNGTFTWAPGSGTVVGTGWVFDMLLGDD